MANQNSLNSLNPEIHPAIFNGDLPQGVLVDYIFYRDLVLRDSYLPKVTVSDHLPVIAEFDI
jgi:endonuclease/exonuclease/phosphatase (EEP) superfamily protein YafD